MNLFRRYNDNDWRDKRTGTLGGLGDEGDYIPSTRQRPNTKKAGRFPIRGDEGPTKNLLKRRTEKRPARHEDTMVLAGIFLSFEQKSYFKLGRFSSPFAEITDVMSSKPDS